MPGPPAGPSPRITTTSPAWISCASTAAIAASSPSNTRAGPACLRRSWPASLTTQPSGATLPRRIAKPPVGLSGSTAGARRAGPAVSARLVGVLADRRAGDGDRVGVEDAGLLQAVEHQRHAARLVEVGGGVRPPGCRSHSSGVRSEIASNSSISSGTPISRATASRCSTPLVEPPLVATAAIAFSSAGLVMISLGQLPAAQHVHHEFAALPWRPRACGRPRPAPSPSPPARCRAPRTPSPSCWR